MPAYNFLTSEHDKAIHTRKRYTISKLKRSVEKAGFIIEKITYSNLSMFPIICIWRLLNRKDNKNKYLELDLYPLPKIINQVIIFILSMENLVEKRIRLPFGLSLFCVAKKA